MRVEDNGLGIAPKDQDRIFEPFVRLGDGRASGTGLGLSVSRKLADSMGGTLRVESEPGIGSVFSFLEPGGFRIASMLQRTSPQMDTLATKSGQMTLRRQSPLANPTS